MFEVEAFESAEVVLGRLSVIVGVPADVPVFSPVVPVGVPVRRCVVPDTLLEVRSLDAPVVVEVLGAD